MNENTQLAKALLECLIEVENLPEDKKHDFVQNLVKHVHIQRLKNECHKESPLTYTQPKSVGRPKSSNKTERMTLVMTPLCKCHLMALAGIEGKTAADLLEDLIETAYQTAKDNDVFETEAVNG